MLDFHNIEKIFKDIDKKYRDIKGEIIIIIPVEILVKEWQVEQGTYLYPNYDFDIGNMFLKIRGYDGKLFNYHYIIDDDATIYRPEAIRVVEVKELYEIDS